MNECVPFRMAFLSIPSRLSSPVITVIIDGLSSSLPSQAEWMQATSFIPLRRDNFAFSQWPSMWRIRIISGKYVRLTGTRIIIILKMIKNRNGPTTTIFGWHRREIRIYFRFVVYTKILFSFFVFVKIGVFIYLLQHTFGGDVMSISASSLCHSALRLYQKRQPTADQWPITHCPQYYNLKWEHY